MTLEEQHRRAQLAVRALTLRQLLAIWPAFDLDHIADSWPAVQEALIALIQARGATSAGIAAAYYDAQRIAAGVPGNPTVRIADVAPAEEIIGSLLVTGPATAGRLVALQRTDAAETVLTRVAGTVGRFVLDAGRDTLMQSVKADRQAAGYSRVTSGRACDFCSELAGVVWTVEERADFSAHDHCSCMVAPAY